MWGPCGQTGETHRPVRSCAVCHLFPCYYAQSQINTEEAPAEHHTPKWGLTSSLCGELGPVTPNQMSVRISRLPAWQCSGNIPFVQHKLTKANVELEAWMDWCNVWWSTAHLITGRDLEMMPVIVLNVCNIDLNLCACWGEHKSCHWLIHWMLEWRMVLYTDRKTELLHFFWMFSTFLIAFENLTSRILWWKVSVTSDTSSL